MANFGYYIVKTLRNAGIDAELLMQKYPSISADPKALDKELNQEYPDWIHFWDNKSKRWKSEIQKKMKDEKYDLIHAYVELPMFAYISRRRYVAHSQGSDLRELAFSPSIKGMLLKRAYHKAKVLLYSCPDQHNSIVKLKLHNDIFLPQPWDYDKFLPQKTDKGNLNNKFVIFHPANLDYRLKGNDRFLRAFAKFSKERQDVMLLLIYRGPDMENVKDFLETARVIDKTTLIPGPLGQSELHYYYNISDVVVDQFVVGSIGQIALEAMSCSKPLIAYIYDNLYSKLYGQTPPILNCKDDDVVYEALKLLYDSSSLREELGKKGRQWVVKYHNKEMFAKRCKIVYEGIFANEDIQRIRENLPCL
jgi:glycosyltransferase involved in cell wall biosynthesis